MPFVRIDLRKGKTPEYRRAVANGVHDALIAALQIPVDDRFQVVQEHEPNDLIYDPQYLKVQRSDDIVFIQITLSAGRKPGQKRELYRQIVENLERTPGVRREDVLVHLLETTWENWSFGKGEAQYNLD